MLYAKWIHGSEDIAEAKQVRQAVFVEEQGYTPEQEFDATDALSWHVVALDEETPVGTGRLYVQDGQYCLGRLCVLPEYRGQGIGEAMVGLLIDRAMMIGAPGLHVYAQEQAQPFYEKCGFEVTGEPYTKEGDSREHVDMYLSAEKIAANGCGGGCGSCGGGCGGCSGCC